MILQIAHDTLDLVKATPTASELWLRLVALARMLEDKARTEFVATIGQLRFKHYTASWLHCSAMAGLTGDNHWFVRQAALAGEGTAPDAVSNLLQLCWHNALVTSAGDAEFVRMLDDVQAVRLQQLVAARLPVIPFKRKGGKSKMRVAVYTPHISGQRHGGSTFMLNLAGLLHAMDVDFCVFSGQETSLPEVRAYCGADVVTPAAFSVKDLKLRHQGSFDIKLADTNFSLTGRMPSLVASIHDYRPDLIVFVGFMSPLMFSLYDSYPILGLPIHSIAPMVPLDVWLSPTTAARPGWRALPVPEAVAFPSRFWPEGKAAPLPRSTLGIAQDAVLLVTAGMRLHAEVGPDWAAGMVALLDRHPHAHWVLVGVDPKQAPAGVPAHARIHRVPFQANLAEWLAMCDIYANPPRMGGGGSVVMAMEQGLAVAAFAATDGGDKLGADAATAPAGYFATLDGWLADAGQRRQQGAAMRRRFEEMLDMSGPGAGERLRQAGLRAIERFEQRKGNKS